MRIAGVPSSIEAYYQQVGRAGRDGIYSECYLLYHSQDPVKAYAIALSSDMYRHTTSASDSSIAEVQERLRNGINIMSNFGTQTTTCRRAFILNYFSNSNCTDGSSSVSVGVGVSDGSVIRKHCCDICDLRLWPVDAAGNTASYPSANTNTDTDAQAESKDTKNSDDNMLEVGHEIVMLLETIKNHGKFYGLGVIINLLTGE